jgi:cell fate regulator YaaT (PSP1 superfamily)
MCCLKFENAYYQETFKEMPKVGFPASTPDGEGVVIANNLLRRESTVRITGEDGGTEIKTYPLEKINAKVKQDENEINDAVTEDAKNGDKD